MKVVNLSTLKLNDGHTYYGGAIGNIAYNLLSGLARRDGVQVVSTVEGTDFQGEPPDDLHLVEVDGLLTYHQAAERLASQADVITHFYFHEPEANPMLRVIRRADAPFVLGMVEAPHRRFADELSGLERLGPVRRLGKRVFMRYHRKTLAAADRAIYVTEHARQHYDDRVSGPQGRVVPYGVDTDRFTPANGHPGAPRVLVVSRLIRRRGIQHLLTALPSIRQRVPDVHVDIVGDGGYRSELKYRCIVNDLGFNVTFHGNVDADRLLELYRDAAVFCHLSCDDGFNQPALEALATGTPVVATDRPHNPMVVDGVTGHLVEWAAPGQVAEAVGDLLADPERAADYGHYGRGVVETHYDWPTIAREYERVLQGVVE